MHLCSHGFEVISKGSCRCEVQPSEFQGTISFCITNISIGILHLLRPEAIDQNVILPRKRSFGHDSSSNSKLFVRTKREQTADQVNSSYDDIPINIVSIEAENSAVWLTTEENCHKYLPGLWEFISQDSDTNLAPRSHGQQLKISDLFYKKHGEPPYCVAVSPMIKFESTILDSLIEYAVNGCVMSHSANMLLANPYFDIVASLLKLPKPVLCEAGNHLVWPCWLKSSCSVCTNMESLYRSQPQIWKLGSTSDGTTPRSSEDEDGPLVIVKLPIPQSCNADLDKRKFTRVNPSSRLEIDSSGQRDYGSTCPGLTSDSPQALTTVDSSLGFSYDEGKSMPVVGEDDLFCSKIASEASDQQFENEDLLGYKYVDDIYTNFPTKDIDAAQGSEKGFRLRNTRTLSAESRNKTRMCNQFRLGQCKRRSSQCRFAHALGELRATCDVYKTKLCAFWAVGYCKAGEFCRHAHGEEELRRARCDQDISVKHGEKIPFASARMDYSPKQQIIQGTPVTDYCRYHRAIVVGTPLH